MRIGDLAERTGVPRATIRFYERNGLILSTEGASETNNYRHYPDENVAKLEFYTRARDAGMSVADLKSIMDALAGSCDTRIATQVIKDKILELKSRADQIYSVVQFLERSLEPDQASV